MSLCIAPIVSGTKKTLGSYHLHVVEMTVKEVRRLSYLSPQYYIFHASSAPYTSVLNAEEAQHFTEI